MIKADIYLSLKRLMCATENFVDKVANRFLKRKRLVLYYIEIIPFMGNSKIDRNQNSDGPGVGNRDSWDTWGHFLG